MEHKIALISDIHYGCRNNSENYLSIIDNFFRVTLRKTIEERNITDVRILGDLFDCRNNVNVRTMNTVLSMFRWYSQDLPHIKFKILLGNHDIYYKNRIDINSIECLRSEPNIEIIDEITIEKINDKKIITFPWIVEGSDIEARFKAYCNGSETFDVCFGHFEIRGFEITKGRLDEEGNEQSKYSNFKRVFSGHYHIRSTKKHITYLGCPYQLTWNDYGDKKGIHIYEVNTGETEFVENTDSPSFHFIDIKDVIKNNKKEISKFNGNFIKLVIDKKYKELEIMRAMTKAESLNPLKLDIENRYIEEINDEDSDLDISKSSDPLSFFTEYVNNIEIDDEEIETKKLIAYVDELYKYSLTDID